MSEKLRKIRGKSDPKSDPENGVKNGVLFLEKILLENDDIFEVKFQSIFLIRFSYKVISLAQLVR